jgi:hypothetical protein
MTILARSLSNLIAAADARVMVRGLRRSWSADPLLLTFMIGVAALAATACFFAIAEMATLFGAEAFGNFLRDAGQQVGGAGGLGAAGAGAAGAATNWAQRRYQENQLAKELGIPRDELFPPDPYRNVNVGGALGRSILHVSDRIQKWAESTAGGPEERGTAPGGSKA